MKGAVVYAVEPRFIALDQAQLGRSVGAFKCFGEAHKGIAGRLAVEGLGHESLFDGHPATLAPAGGGHFFDQGEFDGIPRG